MSSNLGRKSRKKQKIREEHKGPYSKNSKVSNENKYTDNESRSFSQRSKLFS